MEHFFFNRDSDAAPAGPPCTVRRRTVGEGLIKNAEDYAQVLLAVEPWEGEHDLMVEWLVEHGEFADTAIFMPTIPHEFQEGVYQGLVAAAFGAEDRGPLIKVKISILGGSVHEVNSTKRAFYVAASRALNAALAQAELVPLEPPAQ